MIKFDNIVLKYDGHWLTKTEEASDYNPLGLPPYTIRLRYKSGVTPTFDRGTAVRVSFSPNVWDLTYNNPNWMALLHNDENLLEIICANTSGVTNMNGMCFSCDNLKAVPEWGFDTSLVTDMSYMFGFCNLTRLPLFDTSNVTNMESMLPHNYNLTYVPLLNTQNVTNFAGLFVHCHSLTNIPIFNTSNGINMRKMFAYCTSLTNAPLLDTSNATDLHGLFTHTSITSMPDLDTSNAMNMSDMFAYCSELSSIRLYNTAKVKDVETMFDHCTKVNSGALAFYQQLATQANPPTNHWKTFRECGSTTVQGAAELAQIPSDWK